MTDLTGGVEARLAALAERSAELPPHFSTRVAVATKRRTRRRAGAGSIGVTLAAVAVVLAGPGLPRLHGSTDQAGTRATSSPADWSPRGPLVAEPGLLQEVTTAWTRDSGSPVAAVKLLYGGPVSGTRFVVAAGTTQQGQPVVGFFSTAASASSARSDSPAPGPLWLRGSVPAVMGTGVVSIATSHLGPGLGADTPEGAGVIAFALGAPGTSNLSFQSSTVDDAMSESGSRSASAVDWLQLFPTSIAVTDSVIRWDNAGHKTTVAVDTGGIGDPEVTVGSTVTAAGDVSLEAGSSSGIHAGDLVMTPDGLVGRVAAVSTSSSTVQRVSDPSFAVTATSDITKITGQVGHVSGNLQFSAQRDFPVGTVNRVLTDTTPAVTIGFADSKAGAPGAVLRPAVSGALPSRLTVILFGTHR